MGTVRVLLPIPVRPVAETGPSPRPGTLRGALIGLLDNRKSLAGEILACIGERLCKEYGVRGTVVVQKPAIGVPVSEEAIRTLAGCDAVITALGD